MGVSAVVDLFCYLLHLYFHPSNPIRIMLTDLQYVVSTHIKLKQKARTGDADSDSETYV